MKLFNYIFLIISALAIFILSAFFWIGGIEEYQALRESLLENFTKRFLISNALGIPAVTFFLITRINYARKKALGLSHFGHNIKPFFIIPLAALLGTSLFFINDVQVQPVDFLIRKSFNQNDFFEFRQDFLKQRNPFLFEDEAYTVISTCSGEWGGTIWFTNKETGIEYACNATCPVAVNKIGGNYIVTASLNHMLSRTQIIQIANPELMETFIPPEFKIVDGDTIPVYIDELESKSFKGAVSLVDTVEILTLSSFLYQNNLYHITADYRKTYLSTIEEGKFIHLETLLNSSVEVLESKNSITNDGHSVTFFINSDIRGYIDVYQNEIDLVTFSSK